MRILDATAGHRAIWFDKTYRGTTFIDIRNGLFDDGINRNVTMDCRHTRFRSGTFDLVVFDPPHMTCGPRSAMARRYGHWLTSEIRDLVPAAFTEFHRILKDDGLVAFKWNSHDTSLERILRDVDGFDGLVGVPTASRTKHSSVTYWVLLRRVDLE